MSVFKSENGRSVLLEMIHAIQENKAFLSEVDGLIGDGDHGINMNKGFTMYEDRLGDREITLAEGLDELGTLLFTEIGGSMGPIYGTVFMGMAEAIEDADEITSTEITAMLNAALEGLYDIVDARVGDKTLVDTLSPAKDAIEAADAAGKDLKEALEEMKSAAAAGRDSTKDLVAKYGRSSRLGERSRGVLDAGATSCCLLLTAMADGIIKTL